MISLRTQFADILINEANKEIMKSYLSKIIIFDDEDYEENFKWLEILPKDELQEIIKKVQDQNLSLSEKRELLFKSPEAYNKYNLKCEKELLAQSLQKDDKISTKLKNTIAQLSETNVSCTNEIILLKTEITTLTKSLEYEKLLRNSDLTNNKLKHKEKVIEMLQQNINDLNALQHEFMNALHKRVMDNVNLEPINDDEPSEDAIKTFNMYALLQSFYIYSGQRPLIPDNILKFVKIPKDIKQINEMKRHDMTDVQIMKIPKEIFQNVSLDCIDVNVIGAFGSIFNILRNPVITIDESKYDITQDPNFIKYDSLINNISIAIDKWSRLLIIFKGTFKPDALSYYCQGNIKMSFVLFQSNNDTWNTASYPSDNNLFYMCGVQYDKIKELVENGKATNVSGFSTTGTFTLG